MGESQSAGWSAEEASRAAGPIEGEAEVYVDGERYEVEFSGDGLMDIVVPNVPEGFRRVLVRYPGREDWHTTVGVGPREDNMVMPQ